MFTGMFCRADDPTIVVAEFALIISNLGKDIVD
jgi:hypothetical protein